MTTEKQIEANRGNALLSTGAKTDEGKAIVSRNAVKHGIFTRELIIEQGDGKEDLKEYEELLQNLIEYFNPQGQLETSLAEKIAVDFWRLKRVIRFETGSIRNRLDHAIENLYEVEDEEFDKPSLKNDKKLDKEITEKKERLEWEEKFLKCLSEGVVDLTKEHWENEDITVELADEYRRVLEDLNIEEDCEPDEMTAAEMREVLLKNSRNEAGILELFITRCKTEIDKIKRTIAKQEAEKGKNRLFEEVEKRLKVLPSADTAERVLRYERSIEKSIFQKIIMIRNLRQGQWD